MEFEFRVLLFSTFYDYTNSGVTVLIQISDSENYENNNNMTTYIIV